jgi:hypothetical protein
MCYVGMVRQSSIGYSTLYKMVLTRKDISFKDDQMKLHRELTFDKPLDKLTVTDFTKMASFITDELGYDNPSFMYLHEYMRQYVAKRRGRNSSLTGENVYDYTKSIAPKYHGTLQRDGKLTKKDARTFRDNGWKIMPESNHF